MLMRRVDVGKRAPVARTLFGIRGYGFVLYCGILYEEKEPFYTRDKFAPFTLAET